MMHARNGHLLAAAYFLFSLVPAAQGASSSFAFDSACVNGCVGNSGCGLNNPKCMCKAAQGSLMETVLGCMLFHCGGDLRDADQSFLGPLQDECKSIGKTIPLDDIQMAQAIASSLVSKLGPLLPTTTAPSPQTSAPPLSTTTTSPTKQTTTAQPAKQTTTLAASAKGTTSPASSSTSTEPPSDTPTSAANPAASSGAQVSTPTADAPNTDPTDSSPFATPIGDARRSMGSFVWASLPLALGLVLR